MTHAERSTWGKY